MLEKNKNAATYEDKSDAIDNELKKRRPSWFLDSIAWFDFEDVCQIIRAHIYQKWDQWDQDRNLGPWVNKIISNQMKNILRNYYSNFVKPCATCPFSQGDDLCGFTPSKTQCGECPLYAKWEKTKKSAYNIKMAITLETESPQIFQLASSGFDIDLAEKKLHAEMKKTLANKQYYIYDLLFVQNKDEEDVARILGYKSNERGRKAGYKQIKNLKKKFKNIAVTLINKKDIC